MRLIFLSRRNAARSQMAEGLLKKHAGDRFEVCSAGLGAGRIHDLTRQVMSEIGIDISSQHAKRAREFLGKGSFDYAVGLCDPSLTDSPRMFPSSLEFLFWPFDDPAAGSTAEEECLQRFRLSRNAIEVRILAWLRQAPWEAKRGSEPISLPYRGRSASPK